MHINPGRPNSLAALAPQSHAQRGKQVDSGKQAATATDEAAVTKAPDGEKQPGVIRHLQEGHFKGVADVRLRIVHAERLAALQQGQTISSIAENAGALTTALSSIIADLDAETPVSDEAAGADEATAETTAAAADALGAFEESVAAAVAELENGDTTDIAEFRDLVQASFAALIEQLGLNEPPVVAPADDTPVDGEAGEVAASPVTEGDVAEIDVLAGDIEVTQTAEGEATAVDTRDYLAELTAAFQTSLDALLDTASESILPPISEPNGNGKAFDKFMAIYEGLQSSPVDTDVPVDGEPTDVVPIEETSGAEPSLDIQV